MARKGRGNVSVTFNTVDITAYCNQADLSMTVDRLETTNFASTGATSIAGDTTYEISVGGDWEVALDTALAPEAITTGTQRTAIIAFDGASQTVTYTWTSLAEIADYTISSTATGKIEWSGTLTLNGAPSSRGVA